VSLRNRLIDPNVIGPTFEQLQQVRGYYSFPKILDAAVDLATRMAGLLRGAFLPPFNAPLERIFTVVYWDQRGSG
jgi:hypothetical protein